MITVSRAVNGSGYVSRETRKRIDEAIRALNYVPNQTASNLRSRQSDLLALILPDITNSFWTTIARGAEDEAWAQGYGVFICNTDNDPDKETGYIERLLRHRVAGVVIVPTPFPASETQLERLRQHEVPFVVVHRRLHRVAADVVRSDGQGGARQLTTELLKRGYRRIAFVGLSLMDSSSQERLDGFTEAHRQAGLSPDPRLIRIGEREPEVGRELVDALLHEPDPPDAILLANSRLAIGGLRAIVRSGVIIPDQLAVAAFYDISALDEYAPALLTATQPAYQMGQLSTRRLIEKQKLDRQRPGQFTEVVLPTTIHLPDAIAVRA